MALDVAPPPCSTVASPGRTPIEAPRTGKRHGLATAAKKAANANEVKFIRHWLAEKASNPARATTGPTGKERIEALRLRVLQKACRQSNKWALPLGG